MGQIIWMSVIEKKNCKQDLILGILMIIKIMLGKSCLYWSNIFGNIQKNIARILQHF
jgi:hypothetical protein